MVIVLELFSEIFKKKYFLQNRCKNFTVFENYLRIIQHHATFQCIRQFVLEIKLLRKEKISDSVVDNEKGLGLTITIF